MALIGSLFAVLYVVTVFVLVGVIGPILFLLFRLTPFLLKWAILLTVGLPILFLRRR